MDNNASQVQYTAGPFILLTFIYFIVGFLTTINGQFQTPMQTAFLSLASRFRNTLTTLIPFFFFFGYLLNSGLAGRLVNSIGYKSTLIRALWVMVGGLLTFALAAFAGSRSLAG